MIKTNNEGNISVLSDLKKHGVKIITIINSNNGSKIFLRKKILKNIQRKLNDEYHVINSINGEV